MPLVLGGTVKVCEVPWPGTLVGTSTLLVLGCVELVLGGAGSVLVVSWLGTMGLLMTLGLWDTVEACEAPWLGTLVATGTLLGLGCVEHVLGGAGPVVLWLGTMGLVMTLGLGGTKLVVGVSPRAVSWLETLGLAP